MHSPSSVAPACAQSQAAAHNASPFCASQPACAGRGCGRPCTDRWRAPSPSGLINTLCRRSVAHSTFATRHHVRRCTPHAEPDRGGEPGDGGRAPDLDTPEDVHVPRP